MKAFFFWFLFSLILKLSNFGQGVTRKSLELHQTVHLYLKDMHNFYSLTEGHIGASA